MKLRPYQKDAVQSIYDYYEKGGNGDVLVCIPTAGGKSIIQADFIKGMLEKYPTERVMLVTHVKELLQQNYDKLKTLWPDAPAGLYSAGLRRRETLFPITIAGIQSCWKKAGDFGAISLVIVDESHLIPKKGEGMYRTFLRDLKTINPYLKVIGLTATPYRMSTGLLHEGEGAIFDDVCYEATIEDLMKDGYLCPLISKLGDAEADLSKVKIRGGEFIADQLNKAMDREELIRATVDEIVEQCADRQQWLVFCSGVSHAMHVRDEIRSRGISSECVVGTTQLAERDSILTRFDKREIRAVTNVGCLTTGYDSPSIDAIILLRPTKSPGLNYQMIGRGLRIHPEKENTLVLDFGDNLLRHGPIDKIRIRSQVEGGGVSTCPMRKCPSCKEPVFISLLECPECGHIFLREEKPKHSTKASTAPILSFQRKSVQDHDVDAVYYYKHQKAGGNESLRVEYRCGLRVFKEWICVGRNDYAGRKAAGWWRQRGGIAVPTPADVDEAVSMANRLKTPEVIVVDESGKYPNIVACRNLKEAG